MSTSSPVVSRAVPSTGQATGQAVTPAALRSSQDVANDADEANETNETNETIVEIKKLWTVFQNGAKESVIHKDLDLSVARGEIMSLVGGSGTGKTVLLRQMLGLQTPTRGAITVLGKPAAELSRRGAASRVGMLFQQGALFSAFTVLENIAFPMRELKTLPDALIREAAMVKLQMVGLKPEAAEKMPSDLSGGMI